MKNNPFTEITGQHTAKLLLTEAIEQNKIAPAYLFSSQVEGVGKGKTALAIAERLSLGSMAFAIARAVFPFPTPST